MPNGLTELHAVVGVIETQLEASIHDAECHSGHTRSFHGEGRLGCVLAALTRIGLFRLTEEAVFSNPNVIKEKLAGWAGMDAHLAEWLGLLKKYGAGRSTRYYPAIEGWAEEVLPDKAHREQV